MSFKGHVFSLTNNVLKELALQITAGSLISSIGQIGKIPTGVQFSLSGQGTGNSISYSPVSLLTFFTSFWDFKNPFVYRPSAQSHDSWTTRTPCHMLSPASIGQLKSESSSMAANFLSDRADNYRGHIHCHYSYLWSRGNPSTHRCSHYTPSHLWRLWSTSCYGRQSSSLLLLELRRLLHGFPAH